jgi:hypothetical protein
MMKHLSPLEQKVLLMASKHRTGYRRLMKRLKTLGKALKHGLLAAAGLGAVLATATAGEVSAGSAVSAPALFNEANAAQRAGRLGPAILDYERAQWLAPGDPAIAQNLRTAREKAGVSAPAVPMWQRPAHWLSFDALTVLASISLLLFGLLFFGTRFIPATLRGLARGVSSSLAVVAVLAASAVALRWPELDRAVIVGAQPVAHLAPAANSATSFSPKPGEIVRAENTYGNFVRVRAADGRSGWVAAAEVEKIIPSPM